MSTPTPGAQTARVGFLVFVALTILVATVMSLGGEQKFWERKIQYEVHFARTNGLQVGAPVSLTGVTIGSVAEMRFPPDPTASYIQVLVNVVGEAAPRIRDNSVATVFDLTPSSSYFCRVGTGANTTLTSALTASATTVSVASATGFPSTQFNIRIDNEFMTVTAGFGTTTWTVVRGVSGSAAASHVTSGGKGGGLLDMKDLDPIRDDRAWAGEAVLTSQACGQLLLVDEAQPPRGDRAPHVGADVGCRRLDARAAVGVEDVGGKARVGVDHRRHGVPGALGDLVQRQALIERAGGQM